MTAARVCTTLLRLLSDMEIAHAKRHAQSACAKLLTCYTGGCTILALGGISAGFWLQVAQGRAWAMRIDWTLVALLGFIWVAMDGTPLRSKRSRTGRHRE